MFYLGKVFTFQSPSLQLPPQIQFEYHRESHIFVDGDL